MENNQNYPQNNNTQSDTPQNTTNQQLMNPVGVYPPGMMPGMMAPGMMGPPVMPMQPGMMPGMTGPGMMPGMAPGMMGYGPQAFAYIEDPMKELAQCSGAVIRQEIEMFEVVSGCETQNRYHVFLQSTWDLNMHLNALKEVAVVQEHVALIIAGLLKWILDM